MPPNVKVIAGRMEERHLCVLRSLDRYLLLSSHEVDVLAHPSWQHGGGLRSTVSILNALAAYGLVDRASVKPALWRLNQRGHGVLVEVAYRP